MLVQKLLTISRDKKINMNMKGKIVNGPGRRKEIRKLIEEKKKANRKRWVYVGSERRYCAGMILLGRYMGDKFHC